MEPLDVLALAIAAVGVVLWFDLFGLGSADSGKLPGFVQDRLGRRGRDEG